MKKYFPLFIDISEKNILVVGGGNIAFRRINILTDFNPFIKVIARKVDKRIVDLKITYKKMKIFERELCEDDFKDVDIILAATDDKKINQNIADEAKKRNIIVNDCSYKDNCDFYFPGIINKDSLVIGVCASGTNHKLVAETVELIKGKIENIFKDKGKNNV